jgi:hypothetical protein
MQGVFCTREMTEDIDGGPRSTSSKLQEMMPGSRVFCLTQVHSDRIIRADETDPGDFPEADGIISRDPADALCIRTADCVPVLLHADDSPLFGAVHAGWRGLARGIVFKAVHLMQEGGAEKIHVSIGPSIRPCCYQVGQEVVLALNTEPVPRDDGTASVDLAEVAALQAVKAGVPGNRIHRVLPCTCCNPDRFFSFRRDRKAAGRNISVIGGASWSLPGLRAE